MTNLIASIIFVLSPSYLLKITVGQGLTINILDIILAASITILLLKLSYLKKKKLPLKIIPVLIIPISAAISLIMNTKNDLGGSLGTLKSFYLLPITLAVLLFAASKKKTSTEEKASFSIATLSFLVGISGLIFFLGDKLTFDGRLSSFFPSPNHLAAVLSLGIIICIEKIKRNILFLFPFFMLLPLLISTESKASLIALFFSSIALTIKKYKPDLFHIFLKTIFAGFVMVFAMQFFLINPLLENLSYRPSVPANAFDSRITIYQSSEKILSDHLFFGIGPNNFQATYLDYQKHFPPYPQWAVPHPHNLLATIWLESGIFGAFAFIAAIILAIKKSRTNIGISHIFITYFLVHGLFDSIQWQNILALIFWFSIVFSLKTDSEQTATLPVNKE